MPLQAGLVLAFGVDLPEKNYGLLQSYERTDAVNRAEAKAPDGSVVSIQEFNENARLTLTYVPLVDSTDDPTIGVVFTFDTIVWQIDDIKAGFEVDGFRHVTITAKHYPKIH